MSTVAIPQRHNVYIKAADALDAVAADCLAQAEALRTTTCLCLLHLLQLRDRCEAQAKEFRKIAESFTCHHGGTR